MAEVGRILRLGEVLGRGSLGFRLELAPSVVGQIAKKGNPGPPLVKTVTRLQFDSATTDRPTTDLVFHHGDG